MIATIRHKLIFGFASLLVLMAAGGIAGNAALNALKRDAHEATAVGDRLNSIALEIQVHNLEAQRRVKSFLTEAGKIGPEKARSLYLEEAQFEIHEMETLSARAVAIAPTDDKRAVFRKLQDGLSTYNKAVDSAVTAAEKGVVGDAGAAYETAADRLHDNAEDGEVAGRDASQTSANNIERTSRMATFVSVILSSVGLVAGIVMSILILRAILRPVNHLREVAESVSMGNLAIQVRRFSNDEIGDLSDSFARMLTAVRFFRMEAEEAAQNRGDVL